MMGTHKEIGNLKRKGSKEGEGERRIEERGNTCIPTIEPRNPLEAEQGVQVSAASSESCT
jgi:hypothetical protein